MLLEQKIINNISECQLCPFSKKLEEQFFPDVGQAFGSNPDIIFIVLRPTRESHLIDRPIDIVQKKFLFKLCEEAKLDIKRIYVTALVKCQEYSNSKTKKFIKNAHTCISNHLVKEISSIKPKTIIILGNGTFNIIEEFNLNIPEVKLLSTYSIEETMIGGKEKMNQMIELFKSL